MATLDLLFGGKSFPVPKPCVLDLLKRHQELFQATTYAVESSVAGDTFDQFVDSVKTQRKITVTQANAVPLWFLSKEFFLSELAAECGPFSVPVDHFGRLSERVSELERKSSPSVSNGRGGTEDEIEKIESLEEGLESLRLAVEKLREVTGGSEQPPSSSPARASPKAIPPVRVPPTPTPSASSEPAKSQRKVEIPMKSAKSLDGIISYLTKKHSGNVQEKGIVTITSKSVYSDHPNYAPKYLADLTSDSAFQSKKEPGQWVCWDFGEMRVHPTHYTIRSSLLKSWVVFGMNSPSQVR
jgi:hypothetical protein